MQAPRRPIAGLLGVIAVLSALIVGGPAPASGSPSEITFKAYSAPEGFSNAHRAGETSIGTVKGTNDVLVQMQFTTARIAWDDTVAPAIASWSNVTPSTNHVTYDPILWTDRVTGRTFVTLLLPGTAITSFTDDGGTSWTPSEPPITLIGFDHETIGSGPYSVPRVNQAYPNATYYCLGVFVSTCSRSDDGGSTWGPPVETPLGDCIPVHGRVVVAAEGSVYLPRAACGSTQGLLVSRDEGATWKQLNVPGTVPRNVQGSGFVSAAASDAAGRLYFAASSAGRPVVATSTDGGVNWSPPADVGTDFEISNTEFPIMVAGDAGRAAFAFYGTATGGDDQSLSFTGVWHLYVSFTFDGGATWQTVNATPADPVQRGCINFGGANPYVPNNDLVPGNGLLTPQGRPREALDSPCRNLSDYQDVTVDEQGRVLVSYADGCTSAACLAPGGTPADSTDSLATISRQASGPRLFAAFDPAGSAVLARSRLNETGLESAQGARSGSFVAETSDRVAARKDDRSGRETKGQTIAISTAQRGTARAATTALRFSLAVVALLAALMSFAFRSTFRRRRNDQLT